MWFTIQAVLVKLTSTVINNNLWRFLKSLPENAEGMFWGFAAPHHFKPITNGQKIVKVPVERDG